MEHSQMGRHELRPHFPTGTTHLHPAEKNEISEDETELELDQNFINFYLVL
jgi:hypothetical protein